MTRPVLLAIAGLAAWHTVHPLSEAGRPVAAGTLFIAAAVLLFAAFLRAAAAFENHARRDTHE